MTAIAKRFSKKIFQNIFEKDLEDSKKVLTFASLFASKKIENRKQENWDFGLEINYVL